MARRRSRRKTARRGGGSLAWDLAPLVVLAGGELNSEIEHQTMVDTTVGAPRPMGLRRAAMADAAGAAQGRD